MYSEMLGNKYFSARNYKNAAINYQHILQTDPVNKAARKKLIICYTQTGQIQKAFDNFYQLIKEDINSITDTNLVAEDYPCKELVEKYGSLLPNEKDSFDMKLMLAMLWLYCDIKKSLEFFKRILVEKQSDSRIKEIVSLIEKRIKPINKLTH
jgi:tetratricopeptide (TPR) repeat protein